MINLGKTSLEINPKTLSATEFLKKEKHLMEFF